MKVLMVTGRLPTSQYPGSQSFINRQIDSLRPYCSRIDIYQVVGNKIWKHFKSAKYIFKVSRNYDIIHVHYGLFAISTLLGRGKTPVVLSLMGCDLLGTVNINGKITLVTALEALITKHIVKYIDKVIVKSQGMADIIPHVNAEVVPNGVDLTLFTQRSIQESRDLLNWNMDKNYILFPGNPARPEKNWKLAVESLGVAQQYTENEIILVPLHNVPPDEVPLYINAVDLVLMTSYSEGSPNIVKEALACNKCVISVDVGDVALIISNLLGCSLVDYNPEIIGREIATKLNTENNIIDGRKRLRELSLDVDFVAKRIVGIYQLAQCRVSE